MITGIYKITNLVNGHYYIGQAVDIKARFREHRFAARHFEHKDHNSPIHRALCKYGCENFSYELLEECLRTQLDEKEVYWIDKLKSRENGNYNILTGGQDRMKFDDKPVELYDLEGKYIKTISSATRTAEELGVSRNSVYGVLHSKRPSCRDYQMKYAENKEIVIGKFISRQGGTKAICQIDIVSNQVINTFISAAQAARETNSDSSTIIKVCKGKLKTHNGFKWTYAEDII